ncbi:MAG: Mrp/NBP35 family ATP-binding protein [Deltaproteobacteria bacterium]|jgi:Mrp family chromosome partitioning ATPase|nr:Mrp/NBP35 family ATP-binding protein [Deltaproteobacteria bacterium]
MTTTLGELDQRLQEKEMADVLKRFGQKYLIVSGKGGVGKTTVAVNLAWAKAQAGFRVGLLDVDLHGPDVAEALHLDERLTVDEQGRLLPVQAAPNLWVLSMDLMLARKAEAVMWRGPRKMRAIIQFIGRTAWPEVDFFFIDSPPGTGDETLTVARRIPDLKALMVATGSPLALADVAKAVTCLQTCQTALHGFIDNFSSLICPGCGQQTPLHDPQAVAELASSVGAPLLARLPMDPAAVATARQARCPLVEASPDSPLARQLAVLAQRL